MSESQADQSRAEEGPAPKEPVRRVRRGRVAAAAGAVLVVGAVVAGVGYTVVTVRDADRHAGAPLWTFPEDKAAEAKPAAQAGLAGMLVPYERSWQRGPDLGEFGSDARLSGEQATALRKEVFHDLPRTQRERLDKEIDKQRVQGMAMRSYVQPSGVEAVGTIYKADGAVTVSIVLTQMEDKAAVRDLSTFQNEFLAALDIFRKGPEIKGHKNAKCFLPPKDEDTKGEDGDKGVETMACSAYEGNVLVGVTASGPRDLRTKEVAALLTKQLDRIKEPGAAV
ncbi:hypothetical protein [Streptomyces sp. NPDC002573]|uniref:hypothetical protein n=1 Tax=Streptomyces sp. NPDC002573 TaxID=3364651 RepID=UPI0036A457FE